MDGTTEIRKLSAAAVFHLSQILDSGNAWQKVMAMIPSDLNDPNSESKYTLQHIKLIQNAGEKQNKSCTEILLDEWGTSGKIRPNLKHLLDILIKAQFYRAAEYVAVDLLKEEPPKRPVAGPAAAVRLPAPTDEILSDSSLGNILHVPYAALLDVTNNFNETPLSKCVHNDGVIHFVGHKLGSGAFGAVYYGELENGKRVAVKKLSLQNVNLKNQFETEIKTLSEYRHVNLVQLLGFSCDTENPCLIYEFMSNGSLLDRLQMKSIIFNNCDSLDANKILSGMASNCGCPSVILSDIEALNWKKRLQIASDVCEGIHFLHTAMKLPLIHRDIKSANILLDDRLIGKLGDFGLVKIKPNVSESKLMTSTVFGTSAYMAPEAFRGDVSVKMDVFSFGVVLLELLTGLPPYDENREGCDLVTFVEDVVEDTIAGLLDKKAGEWNEDAAQQVFQISQSCLEEKRTRPVIGDVRQRLKIVTENIDVTGNT
ncbi:hypothetical protein RUM44_000302 [Polyplax serrata]|uniref:non-specific serine/threonine protein kinase n=1 Tax=Polyplax serrata TaxID=468196 RepID=A0ABR1B526_POLSC